MPESPSLQSGEWLKNQGRIYESFYNAGDANGEHGLVLYFDDFEKGFAGFDSDSDGGVSRQLAGKLLTWMQERTSQRVFINKK